MFRNSQLIANTFFCQRCRKKIGNKKRGVIENHVREPAPFPAFNLIYFFSLLFALTELKIELTALISLHERKSRIFLLSWLISWKQVLTIIFLNFIFLGPSGILVRRHVRYGTFGLDSILWTAQPSGQRVYSPPQFEPRCYDAAERFCGHQQFQQPQCRPQLGPHQRALTHLNPSHREGTFLTASKSNFLTIMTFTALSITLHVPEFLPFIIVVVTRWIMLI